MTAEACSVFNFSAVAFVYCSRRMTKCHTSVNVVYDSKPRWVSRREQITKDGARGTVLLKLITVRHKASHSLSPRTQLLV